MSRGALGSLLSKFIGPLTKVAKPLITKILPTLGLSAAISGIYGAIQKKRHGSRTTTLVISNKELNDIMKIIQALEDQGILLKCVSKSIWKWSWYDFWHFRYVFIRKFIKWKRII